LAYVTKKVERCGADNHLDLPHLVKWNRATLISTDSAQNEAEGGVLGVGGSNGISEQKFTSMIRNSERPLDEGAGRHLRRARFADVVAIKSGFTLPFPGNRERGRTSFRREMAGFKIGGTRLIAKLSLIDSFFVSCGACSGFSSSNPCSGFIRSQFRF